MVANKRSVCTERVEGGLNPPLQEEEGGRNTEQPPLTGRGLDERATEIARV